MFRPACKCLAQNIKRKGFNCRYIHQVNEFHSSCTARDVYEIKDEDDFKDRVMRSSVPVIVNFHADWCEPCHSLRPLLQNIVSNNPGRIHLAEVLVDDHASLLQTFEVTAVPAVLGIHRGSVKDKFIGLVTDKEIRTFVENMLKETSQN